MLFEGRRRARSAPNLTPLIDVVFLLLVFFMLTAHFVTEEAIPVALPEAASAIPFEGGEIPTVTIASDGALYFCGEVCEAPELERALKVALEGRDKKEIRIRGDAGVALKEVVGILDIARRAGASGIEIMTVEVESGGGA